jgi:hypothetical protein
MNMNSEKPDGNVSFCGVTATKNLKYMTPRITR